MRLFGQALDRRRPFLISGPCVIESEKLCMEVAEHLTGIRERLQLPIVFKASFDKANRTSVSSFRGLGIDAGLKVLAKVREQFDLPVITDVHSVEQVQPVADVVDLLQTPAFLARQSDLIAAVGASGRPANLKKAQFMAPSDMLGVVEKARSGAASTGKETDNFLVCERGTSFGYQDLVVDMRSLVELRQTGCPVVFDATHSVQQPGRLGNSSGGRREFVEPLARAAVAVGVEGLFMETHPRPDEALSDGPNAVPLGELEDLLKRLLALAGCDNFDRPA